ncbi:thioredoxin family protein [Myxococcus sp. MxC21-1]|uniref:thioredoxin family protein n=1 Tax=Myxococcus sp. MxC21-1 TaxID=3041439 RepID=UPI002930B849|nr:thioredoxin family protein [Myxococcus sp. MxC21-1]WNZ64251.1 thioredoxin family protein [Myxococcus sp. MxC21-1]
MTMRLAVGALLLLWGCATPPAAPRRALPAKAGPVFLENDWEGALRAGREGRRPVLVEAWAPWCQSCRSMRATVLTSPALDEWADRFVWLAVDTDADTSMAFLQRYPVDTWPTFFVLEPEHGAVLARSLGAVSLPQFMGLLEQSERTFQQGRLGTEALVRADALALSGQHGEAAVAYQRALEQLAPKDARRAGALVSWSKSLATTGASADCMRVAARELPKLSRVDDRTRLLYVGMGCALDTNTEEARAVRGQFAEEANRALGAPETALTPLQRSSLYELACEAREATGDEAGLRDQARTWWAFLQLQATHANGAEERAALDSHRVMATALLDQPDAAIPLLERSERELPGDYNPPARLATLYLMAGRKDEALTASKRALALARGVSRGTVLAGHARILMAHGERAHAERLLTEALSEMARTPGIPQDHLQRKVLERTLARLRASNGAAPK